MPDKKVIIIAGPNGAGKTTFAQEYLPNEADCPIFVNADLIAAGLSPFRPAAAAIRAGRLMLEEIDKHVRTGRSFAFETTLAGRGYVRMIRHWRADGYSVKLIFLSLATPEEAIKRVELRVRHGWARHVPENIMYAAAFMPAYEIFMIPTNIALTIGKNSTTVVTPALFWMDEGSNNR